MSPMNLFYNAARKWSPDCPFEFMFAQRCIIWGSVDIWGMKSFGIWLEVDVFNGRCHWNASVYSSVIWILDWEVYHKRWKRDLSRYFQQVFCMPCIWYTHLDRSWNWLQSKICILVLNDPKLVQNMLSYHSYKVYIKCLRQM